MSVKVKFTCPRTVKNGNHLAFFFVLVLVEQSSMSTVIDQPQLIKK